MPDAALYKVADDEAVRALSEQQAAIESVRSRAGLLLSAAAVTTSFLGAQALRGGRSSLCSGLALLCFLAVAATSLAILWPRRWEFVAYPSGVIGGRVKSAGEVGIEDLYRDLSRRMHNSYLENHLGLRHLAAFFQVAGALLTIEVVFWVAAIASDL
ncbi:MAG TPA: hypothetical protein VF125_12150 [Solirubrobacterales bacterium]